MISPLWWKIASIQLKISVQDALIDAYWERERFYPTHLVESYLNVVVY